MPSFRTFRDSAELILSVFALSLIALADCGCGGGSYSTPPPPPLAPSITTQPQNQTVLAPSTATFSVTAGGTAPLSYQWNKNGAAISGATSSTYTTPATTIADDATNFTVTVTNSTGSVTSSQATLTVHAAPSVANQPQSQTITAPNTATFTVTATGTAPLSYQWNKNGAAISGATSASYTTPATTWGTNGAQFTVTVTNGYGATTSASAILTVIAAATANLSPVGPFLIGGQPQNQSVVAGTTATFSATAIGTEPIAYQWSKNGSPINGATSATYTTPATTNADNASTFTVTVTNSVNGLTSAPATLTVTPSPVAPAIVAQPQFISVSQGNPAYYYVIATGTSPLSYQWSKNGAPISGATDSTYTTPPTTLADNNAVFTVAITNSAGTVTSSPANPSTTLSVGSQAGGLGGFQPLTTLPSIYPGNPNDIIGEQFSFQVVSNQDVGGKIIFGGNALYTPGQSLNSNYNLQTNVYSWLQTFANGGCTTFPPLGTSTMAQASLRNATADFPYQSGQQPAVGSAINTSDPINWPVQTYLIDNIPNDWKSDSMSQSSMNGMQVSVSIQRSATLNDVSSFQRCGLTMLSTTYRIWTITTQVSGNPAVVNQVVAPDADAQFIWPVQAMQFFSEFLAQPGGTFTVQYWNFAFMTQSNPVWTPISTFTTMYPYDGDEQSFGVHVVSVNSHDRIEFSNVPGNSYLPGNLPFAIVP